MFTKGEEFTMSRDNISALVMAITVLVIVLSVIVAFTIYFNNPSLNQAWSVPRNNNNNNNNNS